MAKVKIELEEARKKQFAQKDTMLTQQAKFDRDDFLRIVERKKREEANEKELDADKKAALIRNKQTVQ